MPAPQVNPDKQSLFSQFCADVSTAASTVIPLSNISTGNVELLANGNFWHRIANDGSHLVVSMPSGEAGLVRYEGDIQVVAELFFPVPADVSYNWQAPNDTLAQLIQAWSSYSPWVKGLNRQPTKLSWARPVIRTHEKPMSEIFEKEVFICSVRIVFTMPFNSDQVANPYEMPPVP